MNLHIVFHRAASKELVEASAWYESKRLGLAIEFLAEIDRCLALVSKNPNQFAAVNEDVRRIVVHRFPYSVYFRTESQRVVVLAVFHSNRNPDVWITRV
jgi:plasmid stabilization system protein ParE